MIEQGHNRNPHVVVFLNGLPLGLIELKNAANENATILSAYQQLQTYKAEIPTLLRYNAALIDSWAVQSSGGSTNLNAIQWINLNRARIEITTMEKHRMMLAGE